MSRFRTAWLISLLYFLAPSDLYGQAGNRLGFSNLRYKKIPAAVDTLRIDTVSIAPGTLIVSGIPDSNYRFYPEKALLVWINRPQTDSLDISYRALPLSFSKIYFHKPAPLKDTQYVSRIYKMEDPQSSEFLRLKQLEYNGSYGRSIVLGNNQDVVLNSQFNLQVNGYILDSIRLEAAITDNTIPFQPEGNTQRLQEFDQIYIRLAKNNHLLQLGDYNLESPPGYFLKFYKRVQGIYYQNQFRAGKKATNAFGVSGSVAKGQFARNIFQGQEGNQGPYKLTGNNGELFFIILAATERVYIDNVLMERGENADYVINYNTGEVRFMPRRMITKDSRIQVEFEYQDRNYLNSLVYIWDELKTDRLNVRLNVYSNQDAKNQPYLQNLSADQKSFLGQIGDSIQHAFYPNIATDTFGAGKILYKMIDTLAGGQYFDSVFVYSTNPDSARFSLSFSFVGENRGDYVLSTGNANGRVYEWVAPVNGIRQGNYAPVQFLITPKMQQVFILTNSYRIDSLKSISVELGASNTDPNLFSTIGNQTHRGFAGKLNYQERRYLGKKDSLGKHRWILQNAVSYEYVQDRFRAIAPFRNVEFGRDWNVPLTGDRADEHLAELATGVSHAELGQLAYRSSYYKRGTGYTGWRNILAYDLRKNRLRAGFTANVLGATDTFRKSMFYRPSVYGEIRTGFLNKSIFGARYDLEHNEIRNRKTDGLLPEAFSFDILSTYYRTTELSPLRADLTYFIRRDRVVHSGEFHNQNHSHNITLKLGLAQWKNHLVNFTGTYRKLVVDDSSLSNLLPEETLLGRLEYTGSLLRNLAGINTLYEFGSGQEQKRSYTYVEVPAGQGTHTWNDYNSDGIQQANEFELALYPDQRRFIRVFTPTNEYVKVSYVNFNYSLTLDPSYYFGGQSQKGWRKLVAALSSQTSLQISNRLLASQGLKAYNPFTELLDDTSIILTNSTISQSFYFNRNNTRWGAEYNLTSSTGKQLLLYGIEGNGNSQHLYRLRWNITSPLTVHLAGRNGRRIYSSALDDNRSYEVRNIAAEPSITWLHRSLFRITAGLRLEEKKNAARFGGELASIRSANLEFRLSRPNSGVIQLRGMLASIDFNGAMNDPVAFIMLEALQKGSNLTWSATWERRIGKGIEISLEYEGRKPGDLNSIHTGRMSVRAIL